MATIAFHNNTFSLLENGKVNSETIVKYQQEGNLASIDYHGGAIQYGIIFLCLLLLLPPRLKAQMHNIETLAYPSEQNPEWNFLPAAIGPDSIVCLGEESHWVETYLEVKNGLVKTLHQQSDFGVLIFESGFVNAFVAKVYGLSGEERVKETLYPLWQTPATYDLIRYADATRKTEKPLLQLGCDLKGPKSFRFSNYLNAALQTVNPSFALHMQALDSTLVETALQWEPDVGKAYRGIYLSAERYQQFHNAYVSCLDTLVVHQRQIMAAQQLNQADFDFFKRCLQNRLFLLDIMQLPTYQTKHKFRDETMAENLKWLIEKYVPNRKYMIWGADIHLSKDAKWEDFGKAWVENKSMIECLSAYSNRSIFSLGTKPVRTLPRKARRALHFGAANFIYLPLKGPVPEGFARYKTEHDALILCNKIQKNK